MDSRNRKNQDGKSFDQQFESWKRAQSKKQSTPTIPTIFCALCPERPVFTTEESLWRHRHDFHHEKVPPKEDAQQAQEEPEFRLQSSPPITARNGRDNVANSPHEDLSPIQSERVPAPSATPRTLQYPAQTSTVTSGRPNDFHKTSQKIKGEDDEESKDLDMYTSPNRSHKKRAVGDGRSPTSSVRTSHSNTSEQKLASATSPRGVLSANRAEGRCSMKQESMGSRPPTTGKRLFQPDVDNPFTRLNKPTNISQRPQSSPQPRRNHRSSQSASQQLVQTSPGNANPGTIPMSLLQGKTSDPVTDDMSIPHEEKFFKQPETRPISQEQLVAEVKGIYAGLVMVEGKCIQVDAKQAALASEAPPGEKPKLNNEQWQALIALHRTLLHEHHDFFLASQHPSATPAVRRLAIKYAMPARLWRHGIHSFLELLRNRLPDSLDHMLAFIYLAYSMMTLLYETVPAFLDTWIECLGDLGRYRMAIEDDDIRDREVWTQVARQWYLKASDRSPTTGRLYHHLAILARPNALQQLFYYLKALSVPQPFVAARESILTLLDPLIKGKQTRKLPAIHAAFVKVYAILFMKIKAEEFEASLKEFIDQLDSHIGRVTSRYLEQGSSIAISNCLALLDFGCTEGILAKTLSGTSDTGYVDAKMSGTNAAEIAPSDIYTFKKQLRLFVQTFEVNCQRIGDPNILSYLHVTLVFVVYLSRSPAAMNLVEAQLPWLLLATMLNTIQRFYKGEESDEWPKLGEHERPTPEEFYMRGLPFAEYYLPSAIFENENIEDENKFKEDASMNTDYRPGRILWLGRQLAQGEQWLKYNSFEHKFYPAENIKTSSASSDIGAESVAESTDTATLMDEGEDMDQLSRASRSTTGFSEQSTAETFRFQQSSTWESENTDSAMEMEEGSVVTEMAGVEHSQSNY